MSMTDYDNYDFWNPGEPDLYKDMEDDERIVNTICHIVGMVICFFIMLGLCAMCSSCTTTQYIPVIEHHTDTLIQTKVQHDSIYMHDSTIVEKGDSIIKIEHWHTKYVDREVRDTIYKSKTDSIPYPVEVTKEVPAQLTWWQQARMHVGGIVIYGILIILTIKLYRKYAKP